MQRREILKFEPAVDKREGEKNWEEILKRAFLLLVIIVEEVAIIKTRNVRNKENGCYKD